MALADAKILETAITPDGRETIVRLLIADGSPTDEPAFDSIRLELTAKLPDADSPLLAVAQREAIAKAEEVLSRLHGELQQAASRAIVKLRS